MSFERVFWPHACTLRCNWKLQSSLLMPLDTAHNFRIDPQDLPQESVIFGSAPAMREIRERIDRILACDLPVLIQGESGTGKEVLARFLHTRSSRSEAPFVKLNCAAVPPGLLESELFGYRKGSFTGAREDRPGLIEIAAGGTLFFDEIGELQRDLQGKLLRLLEDGSFARIGDAEQRTAGIRVICATNVDLRRAVESGAFREDLFYRIDVLTIRLAALRDRKDDIPQLCAHFLERLSRKFGRQAPALDPRILTLLTQWNWPGNLRELENWVARAIILGEAESLGAELKRRLGQVNYWDSRQSRFGHLKEVSRRAASSASNALILKTLQGNHWNRRKTAEDLKMSYRSLLYKLREAGVPQRRRNHRGFPPPSAT
jgi:two-component system, NtrC family, response regulator AtoC